MSTTNGNQAALRKLFSDHIADIAPRFEQALDACGFDRLLIFAGQELLVARDDQAYQFHAEPYFLQWAPLERAAGSVIELRPGYRPRLVFLRSDDFWHVPAEIPDAFWTEFFEIAVVESSAEREALLRSSRDKTIGVGSPGDADFNCASLNSPKLLSRLDYYRAYKTAYEIDCQKQASEVAVRGHRAVADAFAGQPMSEFGLQQTYCRATRQRDTELPYPSIIGLNRHAAILHYEFADLDPPDPIRSLLIDAGARCSGYASDITRSYGTGRDGYDELVEAMDELQRSLCSEVRPGVDFIDLNDQTHKRLAQLMVDNGLLRCSADEAYETGLTRTFLPHGLGHLLGLQVHDAGGRLTGPDGDERPPPGHHRFLRLTRRLECGFVLTIEPGLYLIPMLLDSLEPTARQRVNWTAVERLLPYGGIRIEDNLLVESDGSRNLTRDAFGSI